MHETWDEAVRSVVWDHKRTISLQEIYGAMEAHRLVTPYYLQAWRPELQPRYQCWTRRSLTTLVRRGDVQRVGKGLYRRSPRSGLVNAGRVV